MLLCPYGPNLKRAIYRNSFHQCGTRLRQRKNRRLRDSNRLGEGRVPLPIPWSQSKATMAATTKTRAPKAKKRAGGGKQVSSKPKASNPAARKKSPARRSAARKGPRHKILKLEEALREEGIDESRIAQGYASVHEKLSKSEDKGDLKLFVDVLEKNSRILEPPRPPDRGSASDGPVTVILKHNVPRPAR
jgi:hypothetical protein